MTELEGFYGEFGGLRLDDPPPVSALPLQTLGMRFHHVGVAVPSIEKALDYYVGLFGFQQISPPIDVPPEHVRVCFVRADPGVMIELVEGVGEQNPVEAILERTGAGTYHICYQVDDIDAAIRILRRNKCLPFKRFEMRTNGLRRFAFLLTPDRQLFELCEAEGDGEASS
ncbi:MAG: VOC family protein [Acidobacteria bacterium]|nr:VOC family protein [Acidobacteriota bacterium]